MLVLLPARRLQPLRLRGPRRRHLASRTTRVSSLSRSLCSSCVLPGLPLWHDPGSSPRYSCPESHAQCLQRRSDTPRRPSRAKGHCLCPLTLRPRLWQCPLSHSCMCSPHGLFRVLTHPRCRAHCRSCLCSNSVRWNCHCRRTGACHCFSPSSPVPGSVRVG